MGKRHRRSLGRVNLISNEIGRQLIERSIVMRVLTGPVVINLKYDYGTP